MHSVFNSLDGWGRTENATSAREPSTMSGAPPKEKLQITHAIKPNG